MPTSRDPLPREPVRPPRLEARSDGVVDCAQDMIETVPAVMDALRVSLRRHAEDDISIPQFRCLAFVSRNPGCSIGQVAAFLGVRMPTASAMVDRLVRAAALTSRSDAFDRRRTNLQVTEDGRARLGRIRRAARGEVVLSLAGCDADEIATLRAAFGILRRTMGVGAAGDDSARSTRPDRDEPDMQQG